MSNAIKMRSWLKALLISVFIAAAASSAWGQCGITIQGPTEGCVPFTARFSFVNNSGKTPTTFSWDFGNGNVGTDPNAIQYTYLTTGCYNVSVRVDFSDGTNCTANLPSQVCSYSLPNPVIGLPSGAGNGQIQCLINNGVKNNFCFTDLSTPGTEGHPITKWNWVFGDGDTSNSKNACHSYDFPGVYIVALLVTDSKGCSRQVAQPTQITVLDTIKLAFNPSGLNNICNKGQVNFANTSDTLGRLVKAYYWDYGNGDPIDSVNYNGTAFYSAPGDYVVTLTMRNYLGCLQSVKRIINIPDGRLNVRFTDNPCWSLASSAGVVFNAREIPGAAFWNWNFGDPDSGPNNNAPFSWEATHVYVGPPDGGPKNYEVNFTVVHPVCGTIDTCLLLHIRGPQAKITLPPPPVGPGLSTFRPAKAMPSKIFADMKARPQCAQSDIPYWTNGAVNNVLQTVPTYCNASFLNVVTDTTFFCNGEQQVFVSSFDLAQTGSKQVNRRTQIQTARTFRPALDPVPTNAFTQETGNLIPENMHDSDMYVCTVPDLVKFTNHSVKYRLYRAIDDKTLPNVGYNWWRDTCAWANYPYASDSLEYLWKFNDPAGLPCTTTVNGQSHTAAGWFCNFSTEVAPWHYFKGNPQGTPPPTRCQTVEMEVTDVAMGCSHTAQQLIRQGPPNASWDKNAFCRMNWDMQRILPSGIPNNPNRPMRGFIWGNGTAGRPGCPGSDYFYDINFSETLPTCGAQDYWITWDSAATTDKTCFTRKANIFTGKFDTTYYDFGFEGATNSLGHLAAAPRSVWVGLPWLGKYYYHPADSGCKTVGVVLKNGDCYDTAWYKDYICFNKLVPSFEVTQQYTSNTTKQRVRTQVGTTNNDAIKICHKPSVLNKDTAGVTLRLSPLDKNMSQIIMFEYRIQRLTLPSGSNYYYGTQSTGEGKFWPSVVGADTTRSTVYTDKVDSITSVKEIYSLTTDLDSGLYYQLTDRAGNVLGDLYLGNFLLNDAEISSLNNVGYADIPLTDFRVRALSFSCATSFVRLNARVQPLPLKPDRISIYNTIDNFTEGTRLHPDSGKFTYGNYGGQVLEDYITQHDSVTFHLPYPGFYTITSRAANLQGCVQQAGVKVIYGHYAIFWVLGGDSTVCVNNPVKFDYKVEYWSTICPVDPVTGVPPIACIDYRIYPDPETDPAFFYPPTFDPWKAVVEKGDVVQHRRNQFPGWNDPKAVFRGVNPAAKRETVFFNFGDDANKYAPNWNASNDSNRVVHVWTSPGTYTVSMYTTDSTGCTIKTERKNFIKVIDVVTQFEASPLRDTFTICAPKNITYKSFSTFLGDSSGIVTDPARPEYRKFFGYYGKVKKNGLVVDTLFRVDSISRFIWNVGDGRPPVTVLNVDSSTFNYDNNDTFDVALSIITNNGCSGTILKEKYIKIIGPKPRFQLLDSAGCMPQVIRARNLNITEYSKSFQWDLGNSEIKPSFATDTVVFLEYTKHKPGRPMNSTPDTFYVKLTQNDSIFDPFQGRYVLCTTTYPGPGENGLFNRVLIYPNTPIVITGDTFVCPNSPANIRVSSTYSEYNNFIFDFGDGTNSGITTDSAVTHVYNSAGTNRSYNVSVRAWHTWGDNQSCEAVGTFKVTVDSIAVEFDVDSSLAKIGQFSFINKSRTLPTEGAEYTWDFGDGTTETTSSPTNTFHDYAKRLNETTPIENQRDSYQFKVVLRGRTAAGCLDSAEATVIFRREWAHYNVFTPNGDGANETFDLKVEGELEYDLIITNRNGQKVFESTDAAIDWNGKVNNDGADCPEGVYYYVWKFKLIGGPEQRVTGAVHLKR